MSDNRPRSTWRPDWMGPGTRASRRHRPMFRSETRPSAAAPDAQEDTREEAQDAAAAPLREQSEETHEAAAAPLREQSEETHEAAAVSPREHSEETRRREQEHRGAAEHLDRVMYVTTPRAWMALVAMMVMLSAVVAWAIFGQISTYVRADGIILSRGGMLVEASSSVDGRLVRIHSAIGDPVSEGELVAEIHVPEIVERHRSAVAHAEDLERSLGEREAAAAAENAISDQNLALHRARLDELERAGRALVETLDARLQWDRALLAQGVVDRETVESGEQALMAARQNLFDALRQREAMDADDLQRRNGLLIRLEEARAEFRAARRSAEELAAAMQSWRVLAPVGGRVTEVRAQLGDTLTAGQAVLGIETGGDGLDVLFYASVAEGKRIEPGMRVLVSPANVSREEHGSMIGTVESLSDFPVSLEGIESVIRDRDLARVFFHGGPAYAGRVALQTDPGNPTGFAWTSPQVEDIRVTPGTLAGVEIEVRRQPPAALVAPWIKGASGI